MAIKPSYRMARNERAADDPKIIKPPKESTLPYGRKGYEQGEGVEVRPGTYDRNEMNPQEEQDYPRSPIPGSTHSHLRSTEDVT